MAEGKGHCWVCQVHVVCVCVGMIVVSTASIAVVVWIVRVRSMCG